MAIRNPGPAAGHSLAILTVSDDQKPFRGNLYNFIDLIVTGKALGTFVFVTTTRDLRMAGRRIFGYVYNPEKKTWSHRQLPVPPVFYNRIPNRKDEQHPEISETIRLSLSNGSFKLFNPFFFNKWTLFEWLNKSDTTRSYIPATKRLSSPDDLERYLARFSSIYLKPIRGKAGKGIMKVETRTSGGHLYRLRVQNHKESSYQDYYSLPKLWAVLKRQTGNEDYIIQQGIALVSFRKRPFDLRVLVQKDRTGRWGMTGLGARVAGKRSITTHVPRGGSIDEPEKLLAASFGAEQAKLMLKRVKMASLKIAKQIEMASGHMLGEMSLDLGVDESGRIWFFEANSRPMKFDEPHIRQKSLERIIYYSQYLARIRNRRW